MAIGRRVRSRYRILVHRTRTVLVIVVVVLLDLLFALHLGGLLLGDLHGNVQSDCQHNRRAEPHPNTYLAQVVTVILVAIADQLLALLVLIAVAREVRIERLAAVLRIPHQLLETRRAGIISMIIVYGKLLCVLEFIRLAHTNVRRTQLNGRI